MIIGAFPLRTVRVKYFQCSDIKYPFDICIYSISEEATKLLWVEIKRKGNSANVAVTEGLLLGVSADCVLLQTRENAGSQATAQASTVRLHVELLHNSILHQHGISLRSLGSKSLHNLLIVN